ncbi:hypothetical protein SRHO_G00041800 [Serrasalmus rhombeus]
MENGGSTLPSLYTTERDTVKLLQAIANALKFSESLPDEQHDLVRNNNGVLHPWTYTTVSSLGTGSPSLETHDNDRVN